VTYDPLVVAGLLLGVFLAGTVCGAVGMLAILSPEPRDVREDEA